MYDMDLKDCFLKVQNGDKDSFAHLYNELKQPVFTIAYRIVQSREIAEDITQEVFVKLYISPPDSHIGNPRAWIFQSARNLSIDALRKKQSVNIDDVQLTGDDTADRVILRLDVESAISKLPCMERQVLTLHLNGDLNFNSIAHIVELSLAATYRKYRRALKTLQNLLNGGYL